MVGYLVLIGAIALLFVQALTAAGILYTDYRTAFFLESLRDFFPVVYYLPFVDLRGVPFLGTESLAK